MTLACGKPRDDPNTSNNSHKTNNLIKDYHVSYFHENIFMKTQAGKKNLGITCW